MNFILNGTTALRRISSERGVLYLIVLLAFALRVYRLDAQAIWWDESLSHYRASRDLATILANTIQIQNILTTDLQPPLYFLLLHFVVAAFGTSEFALRFLSLAANVATVPLVYALATNWLTPTLSPSPVKRGRVGVGVIAAFLAAVSPFYVWFAQEARPYTLVLFWSLLAVYALTRALIGRGLTRINAENHELIGARPRSSASYPWKWILVYILSAIAALYTNYYALFLFPFHILLIAILVWKTARARWIIFLPTLPLASVILLLPIIARGAAGNVNSGPSFVPLEIILRDLLHSFTVGVTMEWVQALWIDGVVLLLFLAGVVLSSSKFVIHNSKFVITNYELRIKLVLVAFLLLPTLLIYFASYLRPLYQNSRYLIAWSPAFYLGVALGISSLSRLSRYFALFAISIFCIGAAVSLNNLYFDPRFGKDDHRAWAESLRERARAGDFLILDSPHTEDLYRYYAGNLLPMITLPRLSEFGMMPSSNEADLESVRQSLRQNPRVWFLAMHVPFDDPQARIEKFLNQEGVLLDRANFHATSTEISLFLFSQSLPTASANEISHPLDFVFDSRVRLLGYDAPREIASGARGIVRLFFQLKEPVGEDYGVSLRVVDDAGTRWGQYDTVPLGNRAGSSTWAPKKIIVDAHDLPIERGTPAGKYYLQIQVYHSANSAGVGDAVVIGDILIVQRK